MDYRYDGSVCKRNTTHIVKIGFGATDPLMLIAKLRLSRRDEQGLFVRADDAAFLKDKWRPDGHNNLVGFQLCHTHALSAAQATRQALVACCQLAAYACAPRKASLPAGSGSH